MIIMTTKSLLSLLDEQHDLLERTKRYEAKYGSGFHDFEKKLNQQEQEDFNQWDDFMEWNSINTALIELRTQINGNQDFNRGL